MGPAAGGQIALFEHPGHPQQDVGLGLLVPARVPARLVEGLEDTEPGVVVQVFLRELDGVRVVQPGPAELGLFDALPVDGVDARVQVLVGAFGEGARGRAVPGVGLPGDGALAPVVAGQFEQEPAPDEQRGLPPLPREQQLDDAECGVHGLGEPAVGADRPAQSVRGARHRQPAQHPDPGVGGVLDEAGRVCRTRTRRR